ncbi:MAG: DNA-binding protein [Thermoplasmata archaeon]|nr:MAG: DNA-binding protein [Thermoplasmata archaeon]
MATEDLKTHIEELLNILGDKVTAEELEKEFRRFLEYGVPIEQAKKTLLKKHGVSSNYQDRTLIVDLQPNEKNVHILAEVLSINKKHATVRGKTREIYYGLLRDESGTIPFTAWKDLEIEKGDVIEVTNAYTREWQGNVQLNFGDRVKIEKKEMEIPTSEPKSYKIKDLHPGIGSVELEGVILEVERRNVDVNGEEKTVFSGIIGDETGKTPFTAWYDFNLKKEGRYKIKGGYIKSWRGIPQLVFDENATVEELDVEGSVPTPIRRVPLHILVEDGGAFDVEIEGTVIELQQGSGLINRCPECNRVLINGECKIHGAVEGIEDVRIKCIVDDGTGAASISFNREQTEKLIGKKMEEIKEMSEGEFLDEIRDKILAHPLRIRGNALTDSFGVTFIPREVVIVERNIVDETFKLQEKLEGLQ